MNIDNTINSFADNEKVVLSESVRELIKFTLMYHSSMKSVKGNVFRAWSIVDRIALKNVDEFIRDNNLGIREYSYSNNDYIVFTNAMLSMGFIDELWVFDDGDEDSNIYEFNIKDEDDLEFLNECKTELAKSKAAKEKYDSYSKEYQVNCGRICNPETGESKVDPLNCIFPMYYWTDKLKVNEALAVPTPDEELEAYRILASDELKEQVRKKAKELFLAKGKK
jgi:hypothetical protein